MNDRNLKYEFIFIYVSEIFENEKYISKQTPCWLDFSTIHWNGVTRECYALCIPVEIHENYALPPKSTVQDKIVRVDQKKKEDKIVSCFSILKTIHNSHN